jgi:hypothetical protein
MVLGRFENNLQIYPPDTSISTGKYDKVIFFLTLIKVAKFCLGYLLSVALERFLSGQKSKGSVAARMRPSPPAK